MRAALIRLAAAAPLLIVALPASAQEGDNTATTAIATGAYARAEDQLVRELRVHPNRPELMLNLAAVYARTNRAADARVLYQRVLDQDDVLMDLPSDRTAGSHAIARAGLRRLDTATATASN